MADFENATKPIPRGTPTVGRLQGRVRLPQVAMVRVEDGRLRKIVHKALVKARYNVLEPATADAAAALLVSHSICLLIIDAQAARSVDFAMFADAASELGPLCPPAIVIGGNPMRKTLSAVGGLELTLKLPFGFSELDAIIAAAQLHGHTGPHRPDNAEANLEANVATRKYGTISPSDIAEKLAAIAADSKKPVKTRKKRDKSTKNLATSKTPTVSTSDLMRSIGGQDGRGRFPVLSLKPQMGESSSPPSQAVGLGAGIDADDADVGMQTAKMPTISSEYADQPSVIVGDFMLLGVLGRGGCATVYRARHIQTEEEVALKVLDRGRLNKGGRERFEQEMEICRQFDHPNLVCAKEIGTWNEHVFYSMELLTGRDLATELESRRRPCAPADVINWSIQVCNALIAAHAEQIIHRDIKPRNLFLTNSGTVKVMDFGIARRTSAALTADGRKSIMGTPMYLAPERLSSKHVIDERTDVYSLGVTMYHLLTGNLPWAQTDIAALFTSVLHMDVPPPSSAQPAIGAKLDAVVMRAMHREPSARYADCGALRAALKACR